MAPPLPGAKNSRLELDFEKSPAVLSVLGDGPGQGVFTVDRQARFVGWSKAAGRITGYSLQDVKGQTCHVFEGVECKGFGGLSQLLDSSSVILPPLSASVEQMRGRSRIRRPPQTTDAQVARRWSGRRDTVGTVP